jgi:hypothetical protein
MDICVKSDLENGLSIGSGGSLPSVGRFLTMQSGVSSIAASPFPTYVSGRKKRRPTMKPSRTMLLSWSDRLSVFTSRFLDSETCAYRLKQARKQIEALNQRFCNKTVMFDYQKETIRGAFVSAIEGDFPGTYMVILKIASSRCCNGPCFLRFAGTRAEGIAITGRDGIIGIAASIDN